MNADVRDNWVISNLKKFDSGLRILDAGAGEQIYKKYCDHLQYVSQDFCKYDGSGKIGLQTNQWNTTEINIVSDIINIPENDNSFDVILCTEVFEHLSEPIKAIKEFNRLLKVDGMLLITAPFCSLTHFAPYHFYTGFNTFFYEEHLKNNNFQILELTKNGNFFDYINQELNRLKFLSQYSAEQLDTNDLRMIDHLTNKLKIMSSTDKGSDELLSFGIHVKCKKIK